VIVAAGGGHVVYIEIQERGLVETARVELDAEISCLDINPIGRWFACDASIPRKCTML
jgi:hypothetical protein